MRVFKPIQLNALTVAKLIKMMVSEQHTAQELADGTGLHKQTVYKFLRALVNEGAVHIGAWDKDRMGRDSVPVYTFGPGKNAKRKKMTLRERHERHYAKVKARKFNALIAGPITTETSDANVGS